VTQAEEVGIKVALRRCSAVARRWYKNYYASTTTL
jgi:hypothetical protein